MGDKTRIFSLLSGGVQLDLSVKGAAEGRAVGFVVGFLPPTGCGGTLDLPLKSRQWGRQQGGSGFVIRFAGGPGGEHCCTQAVDRLLRYGSGAWYSWQLRRPLLSTHPPPLPFLLLLLPLPQA